MGAGVRALLFRKKIMLECNYPKPQTMKRYISIPIILMLALLISGSSQLVHAQESEIDQNAVQWQQVKEKSGVSISRRILVLNGIESRETKASAHNLPGPQHNCW